MAVQDVSLMCPDEGRRRRYIATSDDDDFHKTPQKLRPWSEFIECFRAAQRGGANLLHFCGSPDPSFVQQNEPFLP